MIDKDLHERLKVLSTDLKKAQNKIALKKVLHKEDVTLRELKARHELLTEQLRRDVRDPQGIGFLETAFRRWVNRIDFDE